MKKSSFFILIVLPLCSLIAVTIPCTRIAADIQHKNNHERDEVSYTHSLPVTMNSSFINPLAEVFGEVSVGKRIFVANNTILRADPGGRICIDSETNFQDNIIFLALRGHPAPSSTCGALASSTEEQVSIAHQAKIKNSKIGKFTFIGFRASLDNVVLEDGAFVMHGATLSNVRIGKNRLVPIGTVIKTQAQADALPLKTEENSKFQHEVLEVNKEFAENYSELYKQGGYDAVSGVSPAPKTSWNPNPVKPTLGKNVKVEEFACIVGDVRLGSNSTVGRRTSIRADEGSPIMIGEKANIESRVTFHALKGTSIRIGKNLNTSDNIVFHGPLEVGDNLKVEDDAILFRSQIGNNVTIGHGAIVVGVKLRDGVKVPSNAVITTQQQADVLK
ncbi:MAG: carbonate dehydratase [Stigonema ocellatum SAG 48.90 = DSM 106950]|nr:carbonate dehydratase [Stigonema ocellatum SAG 48.90 = DSM 106950]